MNVKLDKSLERFLIPPSMSIKEAMRHLEETEERVLFVTDESDRRLLGSLSDGDVRRWILSEGSLNEPVRSANYREPYTVGMQFDLDAVRAVMLERRITCVPVLDAEGRVIDLLFWAAVFSGTATPKLEAVDAPVVIMAGGKGTRLEPFTRILPKPLVPIGDRAVVEIIIDSFRQHDVGVFYISVNHKAGIIKAFFAELEPDYEVRYIEEREPRGTAGGLYALRGAVQGPIIVTNCDVVAKLDYADLMAHHQRERNLITLVASLKPLRIAYGVCELGAGGQLAKITEKPELEFLVNTGLYVIDAQALDLIPEVGVFHTTDLISLVQARGGRVGVFPISGDAWLDTGEWSEYRKTIDMLRFERRGGR
jgi:dTDP-glucose pyrophosphorylase